MGGRRPGQVRPLLLTFSDQLLWFPCNRNTTYSVLRRSRHRFIVSPFYPYSVLPLIMALIN